MPRHQHLLGEEGVAVVEGRHAAALQEGGRAGGVDLDDALDRRAQRARRLQPADAPARHRPVLGEGVGEQQLLLVLADVEEGGRARLARARHSRSAYRPRRRGSTGRACGRNRASR